MARRSNISRISIVDLKKELERRERMGGQLMAHRNRMAQELASIDAELAGLGMSTGGMVVRSGKRGRPKGSKNKMSKGAPKGAGKGGRGGSRARNQHPLHEALHQVLKGKTLGIPEMIDGVKKTGFKSNSANFKTMVAIALGKHKNLFKRVSRGQYTAK